MTASPSIQTRAERAPLRGPLKSYIPPDERIIYRLKPSPLFIVLVPLRVLVTLVVLWALGAWGASILANAQNDALVQLASYGRWLFPLFAGLIALRLVWQSLEWLARLYVMTDRRVIRVSGVLSQRAIDVPLARIQNITVSRSIRERLLGLGTIGFATAGTAWTELAWVMIPKPRHALAITRDAIAARLAETTDSPERGSPMQGSPVTVSPAMVSRVTASSSKRPLVIGLVGGIASGKSAVAQAFASLGCVVCDSDAQAKEALKQPEVREQIILWWGQDILNEQGDLDRAKIAAIVFHDADQRKKLEGLIHPLVHALRAKQIEQMPRAPAFIIDAPLLFEAGVDKECDAVVFVDTPRALRLRRVIETRGWDEPEFDRREKAQLDLKTKRNRSDFEIPNVQDRAALGRRCADLLERIRATVKSGAPYRGGQALDA